MKEKEKNIINPPQSNDVIPQAGNREKSPKADTTADRGHTDTERISRSHTVPNSGGQSANQTDNKQSTVNRGNSDPNVRGKDN
jgi:hypothetical protein